MAEYGGGVEEQLGFEFAVPPRRLTKVSPAKLATFADCPKRFRLAYLQRPTPTRTGPWAHSTLGAVVHNALKALFDLPPEKRTPIRAAQLLSEHWQDAGFENAEQAAKYRDRAKTWVMEYVEHNDVSTTPIGLERWVAAPVSPEPGQPPSMIIEGRTDRIDERGDELVIVDYKTGKTAPDEYEARSSQALAMYAVAAARTLRRPCHRVELHHLPSGTIAAAEHTVESLRRHLARAEETAEDLRVATDTLTAGGDGDVLFPANTSPRCAWCDFRPSCEEGRQAAPAAKPWELLAP